LPHPGYSNYIDTLHSRRPRSDTSWHTASCHKIQLFWMYAVFTNCLKTSTLL